MGQRVVRWKASWKRAKFLTTYVPLRFCRLGHCFLGATGRSTWPSSTNNAGPKLTKTTTKVFRLLVSLQGGRKIVTEFIGQRATNRHKEFSMHSSCGVFSAKSLN
jgi:hypothetical protein